jgi:ABC-type cobalamin/Fe3+-siderophores transport system ATPase subunit
VLAAGATESMLERSLIRRLYGVDVDITEHPGTGRITVIPIARAAESPHA